MCGGWGGLIKVSRNKKLREKEKTEMATELLVWSWGCVIVNTWFQCLPVELCTKMSEAMCLYMQIAHCTPQLVCLLRRPPRHRDS